jgi:hypothetical protein
LLLSACAPIPVAATYGINWQHRMQSVSHWKLLADDTAKSIAPRLGSPTTLYVIKGTGQSPFGEAFETYLVDSLEDYCLSPGTKGSKLPGRPCSVTQGTYLDKVPIPPEARPVPPDVTITYGVQRVHHLDAATGRSPPGLFSLLGAGIWLGHQASKHWSAGHEFAAAFPTGVVLDVISGSTAAPTHTEVVVSVLAARPDGTVIFQQDRSYYVDDADAGEYPDLPLYAANGETQGILPVTLPVCR